MGSEASQFLAENSILDSLMDRLGNSADPFSYLLEPLIIGLFGNFFERGSLQRQFVLSKEKYFTVLEEKILEENSDSQHAAISAASRIGSHPDGFRFFYQKKIVLKSYLQLIHSLGETKSVFLKSFAYFLRKIAK